MVSYYFRPVESQDEEPNNENIEQQSQQEGFIVNLSKVQKSQYGTQFGGDPTDEPGIVGKFQIVIVTYVYDTFIFNWCPNAYATAV